MKKIYSKTKNRKIKKTIKILFGIILGIFLIFQIRFVDAGMNDSVMAKNRMDGVYAVTNLNGERHLYYLDMYTMNGRTSYCIDLGVPVTSELYHSTWDFSKSSLSSEQILYIKSISYFGYQYPGHEDYRFYMAAQEIIWEYLSGAEVEWTMVMDINGVRMDIESFKQEIIWLRDRFYQDLYFWGEENLMVSAGETIELVDYNGLLDFYELSFYQNSNVWFDGNSLMIQTMDDYVGRSNVLLTSKNIYSYDSQLYYYDRSQRLISNGNIDRREKSIWFYTTGNTVNIQLVDGDTKQAIPQGQASLQGAIYELVNDRGEVIDTFSTDLNGQASIDQLVNGHYVIRQVEASLGYLRNEELISFDVVSNDVQVVLEEHVITNMIELLKVYGKNESNQFFLENDVQFSIWNLSGSFYDEITTDELGIASVQLPYGTYLFKQENTVYGYSKVDDFEVVVDEVRDDVIRYTLVDPVIQTKLQITTFDQEHGEPIRSDMIQYRLQNKEILSYYEYEGTDVFSTDLNGQLVFPFLLPYGEYIVEQVGVPDDYVLNSEKYEVTIDEMSNFLIVDGEMILNIDFYNRLVAGEISILTNKEVFQAHDNGYEYQREIREKIELQLVAQEDIVAFGELKWHALEEVATVVTDENGYAFLEKLYLGNYCLVEKESGLQSCFDFQEGVRKEEAILKEIEMTVLLEKTDVILEDTSEIGNPIEGAIVEFYDWEKNLIYTGITNEEGIIKVVELPKGNYCLHQKEVPNEYLLYQEDICFEIDNPYEPKRVTLINSIAPKRWIQIPNTSTDQKSFIKLFFLALIGLVIIIYEKNRRHRVD